MSESIYILDGHYLIYRSYHAMSKANLRNSSGQPTGAVYGVLRFMVTLLEDYDPDYIVCAYDSEEPTFRKEFYEDYKIQRPEMPDELRAQMPIIEELFEALNIPVEQAEGFESDDLLASMVDEWSGEIDGEFVLVSNDKDNFQLADGSVKVLKQKQGLSDTEILTGDDIEDELGVPPGKVPDFLSLVGDSVDNIPGVEGIGPTYAGRLLNHFDSVEEMLESPDEISDVVSDRLTENILDNQDQIHDSKHLVQLRDDAPLSLELDDARFEGIEYETLVEFCRRMEFTSIREELEEKLDITPGWDDLDPDWEHHNLEEFDPSAIDENPFVFVFLPGENASIMQADRFYTMILVEGTVHVLESSSPLEFSDNYQSIIERLSQVGTESFQQKHLQVLAHRTGSTVPQELSTFDLKIASYLVNPDKDHEIRDIVSRELGTTVPEYDNNWDNDTLHDWLSRVTILLSSLCADIKAEVREKKQEDVLEQLELPLTSILAEMEFNGIALDSEFLEDLSRQIGETIESLRSRAHDIVGESFNLNSPKQLREILFDKLELPVQSKTDSGKPSTNAETLEALSEHHELPEVILEYRHYNKIESTYLSPLVEAVNPNTQKVHTEFNQTIAATGRLTSSRPNLQNIPVRDEFGRRVREAFTVSEEDYQLLAADYSQIELRLLAHMSQDEALMEAFNEGRDVHTTAAADIFEKDPGQVDEDDRRVAKVVNYGIAYGLSAHGLSSDLDISRDEAQNYIDRYFERYPGVRAYLDQTIERARDQGYVETLWGRRRYIPELNSNDYYQQQFADRAAVNAPIQGTAADLMKKAMIDLDPKLEHLRCRLLLQVHDELVLECHQEDIDEMSGTVESTMADAIDLRVPVTISLKTGDNWGEVSK
ncbi:MAG: DNA polymerase I [bacterium]